MTSRPPRVLGIEMERLWNAPVAGASYSPLDSARQRSQSRERQPEMSNGDMQGLLEHDQHDQDIDVDEEAAVLRLGGQSSENLGWARPPINPFRRGFWEKLPNVWFFPDTLKQAAYATGVCMVLLAVVFGATVGLTVLANHRHRGPAAPSYQYDGAATQSDTCDASFPRTYCGAVGINKGDCEAQGCCWGPDKAFNKDVPSCYQPNTAAKMGQYKVKSKLKTELGWSLHLELNNRNPILPTLGPDMKRLQVTVDAYTRERLHIKIEPAPSDEDQAEPRWEVPADMVPRPLKPSGAPENPLYDVKLPEPEENFWIEVYRVSGPGAANDTKPVFSTRGWGLVFKDQYMQLTTHLEPSSTLIGTGESTLSTGLILPRNGKIITMWNTDTAAWNQDVSLYGSHPFYLELRQLGGTGADRQAAAHGVFLLNSNGMDIELWREHLTYRVIGGVFDFSILMGPEPEAVTQQYHEIIGLPVLPARWALGYHQCRWGYKTVQDMMDVVVKHLEAKLPLDVMWSDIDYMLDYRVWTLDPIRYTPEVMNNFVQWLHAQGLHWVPIQDPAVQLNPSWPVWNQGVEQGVFVRDTGGKEPYLGQVWAGPSAWPDFFNEKTKQYWSTNIAAFRQMVPADGLWLDMNEASNFCSGACTLPSKLVMFWRMFTLGNNECLLDCVQPDHSDKLNDPPYRINVMGQRAVLYAKTIVTSGKHANGYVQYDTHNMYALSEAKTTYEALAAQTQQRPFILSRASFPGLGRYSAHWTGDNWASWEDLRRSVTGMLNSNLWGIPLVGSDICGFSGESNEHLCARWMEVGAFTPFSRNHADIASPSHEAYLWPKTRLAAGAALRLRYRLLPVLYTQFHNVAQKGGTVARAIFWEWPGDEEAIKEVDKAWMLGNALMIAPVLWEDRLDGRNVYFPKGTWYRLSEGSTEQRTGPAHVEIKAPIGEPSVWARAGYILPTVAEETFTTIKAFAAPLRMLVLLPAGSCNSSTTTGGDGGDGEPLASGELYADDGLSLPTDPLFVAVNLTFTAGCGVVNGQVRGWLNFNAVTPAAGAGEAGRKLQQNTGDKKWDPSQVLVSQVHVAGMPAPLPGATWTVPKLTVDTTRGVAAGALLTEEVCSTRTVQVTFDQERVQLTLERPIPLICLTRVEWDVPVA